MKLFKIIRTPLSVKEYLLLAFFCASYATVEYKIGDTEKSRYLFFLLLFSSLFIMKWFKIRKSELNNN